MPLYNIIITVLFIFYDIYYNFFFYEVTKTCGFFFWEKSSRLLWAK